MVKMMDTQHNGCLNFCEMVGLLWDFLSRDPRSLGSFAFFLFDKKKCGLLHRKEVTELVESLHHTTAIKHKGVSKIVQEIMNYSLDINVDEFHQYCRKHDEVCLLLLGLQTSLRERILGARFWESIMHLRHVGTGQMAANYIQLLFAEMNSEKALHLRLKKKMDRERKKAKSTGSFKKRGKQRRSSLMQLIFVSSNVEKSFVWSLGLKMIGSW
jgi:hypothetical protein